MGGSGKITFFQLCGTHVLFCCPKVCQAHHSETEEDLCSGEGRGKTPGSVTGDNWGLYLVHGAKCNPDQLLGLATFKAVCAAEDLELPLIMVQSIKSYQLVSLRVFGGGLWQKLFGNLNPLSLRIALTTWVLLLQRTPLNAGSMACLCRGCAFHVALHLSMCLPILSFCIIPPNLPCTDVRLLFLGSPWDPF